ncbi:peptide chain release factor 3 [Paenibacillus apiarius]|uniref:Peptide chain release factor 3 n=1 Tax=Paenibacillus apiarius TaxID=46240 RepID=A0ABT4E0E8_9BACL|nr:peptide chain release factor 3 [Paenibacillus apiarius]MBN3525413.1 peptide chain release factor 3 [Paenibacillus apiarius]MCY9512739.1 peptide chain release factor 3 [Paenibacillus apiarius]MCY9523079.1 peptide chain release factor 3 [Paenibacillus apiarius]MCY9555202.1 peptide chain release factor 3 [Paenibacillus apiarius]MCY9556483.1 peptide chain release factor 3 [Paenibacillus apiarius]
MSKSLSEQLKQEVEKRRTFAIISHPDAGKTTLTEKLLLFGGAIRLAGTVKARKASKHATSDWMEIEKQRGISVTSSVMQFDYKGHRINILDTPGHQDFSEDTYRTLTAADSAVMLIDVAKGVEAQTIKLFQVCAKRGIPIFTFINKLDREGRSPFELMEEIEQVLGIRSVPMNWPIGMGRGLCGVYDRMKKQVELFQGDDHSVIKVEKVEDYRDPVIRDMAGDYLHDQLCEELELLDVAGDEFDYEKVKRGELTPVFFGSAINNFGVQTFLENFLQLAPKPEIRQSTEGPVDPTDEKFTGYIFKIQANMNPAHRDRIAFLRICSGKFERGMSVKHVRAGKEIKLAQPQQFLAQDRDIVQEAFPGDIIGLFDPGIFRIGDSLSQGSEVTFDEMPTFSPEIFARVTVKNALKHKQYQKGVDQLTEEGTIQVFHATGVFDETILGVVGQLQFEVFEYRMKAEYGVEVMLQRLTYQFARWVSGASLDPSKFRINSQLVTDKNGNYVALFENEYAMRTAMDKMPDVTFSETAP